MNDNEEGNDEIVTTHVHAFGDHEFHVDDTDLSICEAGCDALLTINWAAWDVLVARIAASREALCPTQPAGRGRGSHKL
jgi:hypothetical protein